MTAVSARIPGPALRAGVEAVSDAVREVLADSERAQRFLAEVLDVPPV